MDRTEEVLHETEEQGSESAESVTESVGSPHGSSSSVITVLDSDGQEEEEGIPRGGMDTPVQHHDSERVSDPQPHGVEEDDDANSEDFQEPAAKRKKRDTLNSRDSAKQDEESKLNVSTDDVSLPVVDAHIV